MGLYGETSNVGFQTSAVLERMAPVLCLKCDEMGIFYIYSTQKQMILLANRSIVEINDDGEMI